MKCAKAIFQVLCAVLVLWIALACSQATDGLTTGKLWELLQDTFIEKQKLLFWGGILMLQLAVMRWLGVVWNVVFSLLSFLFMAELVMLAGNLSAAATPALYQELKAIGAENIVSAYPAAYWLIPVLWLVACLFARDQVRVFMTAVVCYGLWLLLAWLFQWGVSTWLGMGEPAPEQLADVMTSHPWLSSAMPGCFLLIYALLMAIFEVFIPRKKKQQPKEEKAKA